MKQKMWSQKPPFFFETPHFKRLWKSYRKIEIKAKKKVCEALLAAGDAKWNEGFLLRFHKRFLLQCSFLILFISLYFSFSFNCFSPWSHPYHRHFVFAISKNLRILHDIICGIKNLFRKGSHFRICQIC